MIGKSREGINMSSKQRNRRRLLTWLIIKDTQSKFYIFGPLRIKEKKRLIIGQSVGKLGLSHTGV